MLFPSAVMWIVFGAVSAFMAKRRGKNPYLWFFLGTLFGVFGLLFLFFGPKGTPAAQKANQPPTIDITPKVSQSDKEKLWYYLDSTNKQEGPMSYDALLRTYSEGTISKSTHVWNENFDAWKRFSDLLD